MMTKRLRLLAAALAVLLAATALPALTSSAQAAGSLGAVTMLRVASQSGDAAVVAWGKPRRGKPSAYRVTFPGSRLKVSARKRQVTLSGLAAGSTTRVAVRALKGRKAGPVRTVVLSVPAAVPPIASPAPPSPPVFGAIPTPTITASASGASINVTGTWQTGGKNVDVVVRRNDNSVAYQALNVTLGSFTATDNVGYSQSRSYTITISDTPLVAGQTTLRTARSASASATTPAPPGPVRTVTVSRGSSAVGLPGCTAPSCAYVQTTTANFAGTVTCSITSAFPDTVGFISWTQGANATRSGPNYYGYAGRSLTVTCGDGQASASGSVVW